MNPTDFTPQAPGRLIRIPEGVWGFVPNPLPPPLQFDLETINVLSEADRALGEIASVGRMLPNPRLLTQPFMRREAVSSSRIEGTTASVEQLVLFEEAMPTQPQPEDVREVANYVAAMDYGLVRLKTLPVSSRLIRELHERLLREVRGESRHPGEFRAVQNSIRRAGQSLQDARFVPPPVPEMLAALDAFERYFAAPKGLPPLVHMALCHYQFEAIHPFMDGNGRIGRLLIGLMLCAPDFYGDAPLLPGPLLYLSDYFERNREAYVDHLLAVSQKGAWLEWLRFFLKGVAEQARGAVNRSQRLLEIQQRYRGQVQRARASALLPQIIDELIAHPAITTSRAQRLLSVTPRSAALNIEKLVSMGILREVTGRKTHRVYIAPEILGAIQEEG
jgi:Fic family protein